ncbi:hypothetical protein EJB05_50330, partial [Eragrostis curvula]
GSTITAVVEPLCIYPNPPPPPLLLYWLDPSAAGSGRVPRLLQTGGAADLDSAWRRLGGRGQGDAERRGWATTAVEDGLRDDGGYVRREAGLRDDGRLFMLPCSFGENARVVASCEFRFSFRNTPHSSFAVFLRWLQLRGCRGGFTFAPQAARLQSGSMDPLVCLINCADVLHLHMNIQPRWVVKQIKSLFWLELMNAAAFRSALNMLREIKDGPSTDVVAAKGGKKAAPIKIGGLYFDVHTSSRMTLLTSLNLRLASSGHCLFSLFCCWEVLQRPFDVHILKSSL